MTAAFHLRGRHVQHAHGHRSTELADGDHLGCGMIALMPTAADAKRLRLAGGESAEDLHVTLFFLGCDMEAFSQDGRVSLTNRVMDAMAEAGPTEVTGDVFGVGHWNGNGDSPCWVLTVGDVPEADRGETGTAMEAVRETIGYALDLDSLPVQHTPWAPHICMAYTGDLSLVNELQKRLGPVGFDRVRVAFGKDYTDIPLSGALTAAGGVLRREPTPVELAAHTDFARMQGEWTDAVDAAIGKLAPVRAGQIRQIVTQVRTAAENDDLAALDAVSVDDGEAYRVLLPALLEAAQAAGEAQQKEAEDQGVPVPQWSLSGSPDAVTSAAGRDLLSSVARVTSRLLSSSLVQSAVRSALALFGRGTSPELVTQGVEDHLSSLSDAGPRETVGGAVTQAQNEGRRTVLAVAPPARYFASEILDSNSCKPCRNVDGTEYRTLSLAAVAYPSGGYRNCLGGPRCRGTIVAVWSAPGETASAAVTKAEGAGMPWKVVEDHPECGAEKPYAVVKEADQSVEGCHATREEAQAQVDALYAEEGDMPPDPMSMDYAGTTAPWTGPLAVEGITTGDGREFAPDSLSWADLPVPLRWNKEDSHGGDAHTVAVNVGRIDRIWRDGNKIMGEGVLNLAEPDGQRVYDLIKGKFLRGVSIDADSITDADVELVWPEGSADDGTGEEDPLSLLFGGPPPEKMIFHAGRIRAATLVDIPAFAEAYVALTDGDGNVVAGGRPYAFGAVAAHDTATSEDPWDGGANEKRLPSPLTLDQARAAYAWFDDSAVEDGELPKTACKFLHHEVSADGSAGPANLEACSAAIGALHGARTPTTIPEADRRGVYDHVAAHLKDAGRTPEPFGSRGAVTASLSPDSLRPDPAWFTDPGLSGYTGIVVTDEGRLYGHVAPWNACHIGYDGQCVTAPREDAHDHYMTGEAVCSDGSRVAVGQITVGTGHASLYMGAKPAAEHYDNTGTTVADVTVGNDRHGIWLAGAVRPGADPAAVFALRAAGRVSGDWRRIGGKLRLVALLGVNTAGFLTGDTRARARVASGQPMALVAAGVSAPVWRPEELTLRQAYRVILDDLHARVHEGR